MLSYQRFDFWYMTYKKDTCHLTDALDNVFSLILWFVLPSGLLLQLSNQTVSRSLLHSLIQTLNLLNETLRLRFETVYQFYYLHHTSRILRPVTHLLDARPDKLVM